MVFVLLWVGDLLVLFGGFGCGFGWFVCDFGDVRFCIWLFSCGWFGWLLDFEWWCLLALDIDWFVCLVFVVLFFVMVLVAVVGCGLLFLFDGLWVV